MKTLRSHIQDAELPDPQKRTTMGNLARATPDEVDILASLFDISDCRNYAVGQILSGAHVRICDKGARYDDWKSLPTAGTRSSSHASEGS